MSQPNFKNLNDSTRALHTTARLTDPEADWPFDRESDRQAFLEIARQMKSPSTQMRDTRTGFDRVLALRLRGEGWTDREIAARLEISVRTLTRRIGPRNPDNPTKEQREDRKEAALSMVADGFSQRQAAVAVGVTQQAVCSWVAERKTA